MKRRTCLSLLAAAPLATRAATRPFPYRWFYVSRSLREDRHVEDIRRVVRTAAEHGLNGMLLSAGLDRLDRQPSDYFPRLEQVRKICEEHRVAIIPSVFSAGYGSGLTAYNRNLAEGLAVKDALFVVKNGEARLAADPPVAFANGGFEEFDGRQAKGFQSQDRPGEASFADRQVFHAGAASLRLENFGVDQNGQARVMQEIAVRSHRSYRVSMWAKTEGFGPARALRIQILGDDGRALAPWEPQTPATSDWRQMVLGFNSLNYEKVRIFAGVSRGQGGAWSGKVWLDDLQIEEVGLVNLLRRPGTPLVVRGEDGATYKEGEDYAPVTDPQLTFRFDHDGPPIRALPGGRIREGRRLRVSYYHGTSINRGQVTACMSEPEAYEIWRREAKLLHETLHPGMYVLSMDEVRLGGSCETCKKRGLSMAQILGDCITRQTAMLRDLNPKAEVCVWSDMLDPNHNARNNYYLVEGDYTGSWKYVPKDLIIVTWYYARRQASLAHFSSLGFRTIAGAYYDADTLENPRGWLDALESTAGASGIMYTTWENKYELLADFGDLVAKRK